MTTADPHTTGFPFDNSFARELEGLYIDWQPDKVPAPEMVSFNSALASRLGFHPAGAATGSIVEILSGNEVPEGANPLAQAYAGHQFGGLSPQLGDGRAVLLGEVVSADGRRYDIQLKGSGRTPFSRGGDGKAALGPMLREYLVSEAMHALGVPTTRALSVVTTGEAVQRERALPGAVLTRVASSHIRVGTFQFFAMRGDKEKLKRLADYSIERHFPEALGAPEPYVAFFDAVLEKQAELIAKWMLVGFVHGVMNTDNMSIPGETIDYGPCAFLDRYDPDAVFSSIDANGRYSYSNQPIIAHWNLARFAESLLALYGDDAEAATNRLRSSLDAFPHRYLDYWLAGMRAKLGLLTEHDEDLALINALYDAMAGQGVDFTLFFRRLSMAVSGEEGPARQLFADPARFDGWMDGFRKRQEREAVDPEIRAAAMNSVNPLYIPRNHKVEEALVAATETGDYALFHRLLSILERPFEEREDGADYAAPAPSNFGSYVTYCGT